MADGEPDTSGRGYALKGALPSSRGVLTATNRQHGPIRPCIRPAATAQRCPLSRQRIEQELKCSHATAKHIIEAMRPYLNTPIGYDPEMQVLAPESLRRRVRERLTATLGQYR